MHFVNLYLWIFIQFGIYSWNNIFRDDYLIHF